MIPTVPAPLALRRMIEFSNAQIAEYRQQLSNEVQLANLETMKILNLDPKDGWKLNLETLEYIKVLPEENTEV